MKLRTLLLAALLCLPTFAQAADVKISALPAATTLTGPETLPCVQGGVTSGCTANQIKTWDSSSPTLVTPNLGTPSAGVLTNVTGLPLTTGVTGILPVANGGTGISALGAGMATFWGTPSSANLSAAITDETGSAAGGLAVFNNGPTIAGHPVIEGVTSTGATGMGKFVFDGTPTLTTPVLGVATATTINKVTITQPASSAVLTIPDGVTLTGPAASGTAMTLGNTETVTGVKTFGSAGAVGRLKLAGTTSGTTVLDATAVASGTLTLPALTDTLAVKGTDNSFTALQTFTLGNSVSSGQTRDWNSDTFLGRRAAAGVMFGAADAAAPVAQTISFQGARGGTDTNTAAVTTTIQGSLGTGTGAVGDVVISTGTVAGSGTAAHTAAARVTINSTAATFTVPGRFPAPGATGGVVINSGVSQAQIFQGFNSSLYIGFGANAATHVAIDPTGFFVRSGGMYRFSSSATDPYASQVALGQPAAGVVEINTGTAGTLTNTAIRTAGIQGNNTVKALTETSATTFVKITMTSGSFWQGNIVYGIEANDATDFQSRGGILPVTAVDKAGVITCTVGTPDAGSEVVAVSAGTLTNTMTCADAGSNVLNILANATSSLTQTTLQIRYRVEELNTQVITAQ